MDCLSRVGPARVGLKGNKNMNPAIRKLHEAQLRKDIPEFRPGDTVRVNVCLKEGEGEKEKERLQAFEGVDIDRKSTRLNSSHVAISYAVLCLKKKNKRIN